MLKLGAMEKVITGEEEMSDGWQIGTDREGEILKKNKKGKSS